jgi:hypothetical protein
MERFQARRRVEPKRTPPVSMFSSGWEDGRNYCDASKFVGTSIDVDDRMKQRYQQSKTLLERQ